MRVCVLGTGLVFMRGYDCHGKLRITYCLGRTTRVYNTVGCLNVPPVVWCGGVVDGDGRYDLLD